jgi:hypothetical protein
MPWGVIKEGLNSHSHSKNTGFLAKGKLQEFRQTFYCTLTELARQFTVAEKGSAQDFKDGKNILTVGEQDREPFP